MTRTILAKTEPLVIIPRPDHTDDPNNDGEPTDRVDPNDPDTRMIQTIPETSSRESLTQITLTIRTMMANPSILTRTILDTRMTRTVPAIN